MKSKRQRIRRGIIFGSLLLFPVALNYLSPYLIVKGASEGIITGSFLVFVALFVLSIFTGRFFCGWVCPAAGLQEGCNSFIKKRPVKKYRVFIKYVFWFIWVIFIIAFFVAAGGIAGIDFFYMTESVVSLTAIQNYIIYYSVLLLILILNFIFGRRAFCHYLCWMAPFMALGKSISRYLWVIPAVHIKSEPEKCTECGACSRVCPMGLSVSQMAKTNEFQHIDCINCMNCVDTCPQNVLRVGFFKSRPKKKVLESECEEI